MFNQIRFKLASKLLMCFFLFLSLNVQSNAADKEYTRVIESGNTVTTVRTDSVCMSKFADFCELIIGFNADTFEHNYISYIIKNMESDDFFLLKEKNTPKQDLDIKVRVNSRMNLVSFIINVKQQYLDTSISYTQIENMTLDKHFIRFKNLFSDPEMAAVICANKVYETFAKYDRQMLPFLKVHIENKPNNFIILNDGLEFDLSQNRIAPKEVKTQVKVSLEELYEAKPLRKWFPLAPQELTFEVNEQEEEALE